VQENRSQCSPILDEEGVTSLLCRVEDFSREQVHLRLKIHNQACNIASGGSSLEVWGEVMGVMEYT